MARTFTVAQLITKGRRRCNQENSELLSAAEWQEELSSIYSEFHGLVAGMGARIFEGEQSYTTDGGNEYTLPADFLSELGVDYQASANDKRSLAPLLVQERNAFQSSGSGAATRYSIVGDNLRLYPTPPSGQTYVLVYVPQADDISGVATSTNIDVIAPAGEQFFVWSLALAGGAKQQSDLIPYYESKVARYRDEVRAWAFNRSLTAPRRKFSDLQEPDMVEDDGWWP